MIRIAELRLPLDRLDPADPSMHPLAALRAAAAERLGLAPPAITQVAVFKRSFDARRADLLAVYIVDVALADPAQEA
ncbi:MAG: FAD-dependent oxidoreductase, partial [Burkholderiaceae bacterium]|nr:FAD-dependent oxidoreductase [Burkholderiaceae bacterium]